MALVYRRFQKLGYGFCQRALCDKQAVIPMGMSDVLRKGRVKVFCPKCEEVYIPTPQRFNVDGAFFGPSLPHMFLKEYASQIVLAPVVAYYEPKVFGFGLAGKRGSKFFRPCTGDIQETANRQSQLCADMLA